jgi:acetolactate synthase-1/2/3 large subunit
LSKDASRSNNDNSLSGAQMLIQALLLENVDTIFGYPGGAVLPIYDVLYDSNEIRHILMRHEQAVVHAADGYARVTGRTGVALVTSGPGATNAITGIATAYMDSVPMVIITGQVPTELIGRDSFQEVNIYSMTMDVTKHNYLVMDVEELPRIIKEAFYIARTGRPGPVLIDIPKNVMNACAPFDYTKLIQIRSYNVHPYVEEAIIQRIAEAINRAHKPIIICGGGIITSGASPLLIKLAEETQIPIVSTLMGVGAFPSRNCLHLGMLGMHGTFAANKAVHKADLLIVMGVRFSDRVMGNMKAFAPNSYKIHIDIDEAELNKNLIVDLPVHGDIQAVLSHLLQQHIKCESAEWVSETSQWQKKVPRYERSNSALQPQEVIQLIDKMTDGNAIVTTDVGQHQIWTAHHYAFKYPRSLLTSGGLGTMGYGFPAAIGAAFAAPDRQIICVSGDGSFQMNLQELMTAVDYQLPVKVAIMNNGYLGMVRQWQQLFFHHRYSSVKLSSPDYVLFAQSYGATGARAQTIKEAKQIIHMALNTPGPVIMEFNVVEEENVYPIVPPGGSNNEMIIPE